MSVEGIAMNLDEQNNIRSTVQQIADVLLMSGGFLSNPGLYTGEMGIVLFFARYARYTQNQLYLEYCSGLIEKIQNRIYRETAINYKQGLTGIGAAIEYLVQNDFFEADTDEILIDFDQRILFTYNLPRLSFVETKDVSYYAAWRLSGKSTQKDMIRQTLSQTVIPDLSKIGIPDCLKEKSYSRCAELMIKNDFWTKETGLQNGLAGWGMSLLTELDGDNSWISLLPYDF